MAVALRPAMHHHARLFVSLGLLLAGCDETEPARDPARILTQAEFLARYTDLADQPLTADERALVEAGGVLWHRVDEARTPDGDVPAAFITTTGVRVMPESLHAEYIARVNRLANPSDPTLLAQVRTELGLVADEASDDIAPQIAICTEVPETTEPLLAKTTIAYGEPPKCPPPPVEACKVTCNLNVSATYDKEDPDWSMSLKGDIWSPGGNGVYKSDDIWRTTRKSHISTSFTCQAAGCGTKTWSANVTKANIGDGTMSATVAAMTKYPVIDGLSDGCAATAEANASKTSLVMSHNTNDCGAAARIPDTAQALKIRYVKNTETQVSSGTETSGSFSINYKGNVTAANAKDVNFNATGNGLDNLKIDNVAVKANANNNTTAEGNAGAAFASSWRYATSTNGTFQAGDETMSFLNQVQGPPQLTLTDACPAKTVNYKYDIEGLQARLDKRTSLVWAPNVFCSASIKASLPRPPETPDFDCVYTVQGSTDTHSCKGTVTKAYDPK